MSRFLYEGPGPISTECDAFEDLVDTEAEEECPHEELDHGVCMECGEDITEDLAAKAYDRAKAGKYDD